MVLRKPVLASSQAVASSHRDLRQASILRICAVSVGAGDSLR